MALFLECTQLCARSALRKYLTKPALLEMAGYVGHSDFETQSKSQMTRIARDPGGNRETLQSSIRNGGFIF